MAQAINLSASEKVVSYLSRLNPIPRFAEYTGPYKVGTVDVEIPVSELESPSPAPANASEIETVQFRVFYPAPPDACGERITWLPAPQRDHLSAYIKFLGVRPLWAQAASFLPRHLHYTTIPVIKNAPILEPETPNKRWPTAIFSHGLGGNRNAYSQIVGSLASYGVVVICPEHRDGSSVVSFVRIPSGQNRYFMRNTRRVIPYNRVPHEATDEIHELRNRQLRIRLWELGLTHEAILAMDKGSKFTNLNTSTPSLDQFVNRLHVHEPGSIIFMGHSFGSASMVQLLKSVYYADKPEVSAMPEPLYKPTPDSSIRKQVTPRSVTILLDMWCFPMLAKSTKPLFDLPLPAYADDPSAPGGAALLAVESQDFFNWKEHLNTTARALSPDPPAATVQAAAFERKRPGSDINDGARRRFPAPHFFYVQSSAHLNQSDFGVLFPLLTRKVFGSSAPERALRLNLRAVLQVLRTNGVPVARTAAADLADGGAGFGSKLAAAADGDETSDSEKGGEGADGGDAGIHGDKAIFDRTGGAGVEAWRWVDVVGMGEVVDEAGKARTGDEAAEDQEPEMADVIEPGAAEERNAEDAVKVAGAMAA